MLAYKLLSGERYGITTDNPESVRRARSIAVDLGATIQELEQDDGMTQMVFAPAVKS
jgi:TusA-related sulfurtransferase